MFVLGYHVQKGFARLCVELRGTTAVGLCLLSGASVAQAQDLSWGQTVGNGWNTVDLNWVQAGNLLTDPLVAFANGDTVAFGDAGVPALVVVIDTADVETSAITFTVDGYTISESGGGTPFTIQPSGGVLALTLDAGVGAVIDAPLTTAATDVVTVAGTATSTLTLAGDNSLSFGTLDITGGGVALNGDYSGAVTSSGADADTVITAEVAGDLSVQDGRVELATGGSTTAAVAVSGDGVLVASGGTFDGPDPIGLTGGTFDVAVDTAVDVSNDGGAVTVDAGAALDGDVANVSGTLTNNGTILGTIVNSGTVIVAGDVEGLVTNNDGSVQVTSSATLDVVNAGGDLTIDLGQTMTGDVGNTDAASTATVNGTLDGTLTVTDGLVDNNGTVTGATVVTGGRVENSGTLGATVLLDQAGAVAAELDDVGGTITGLVTNVDGVITADGTTFQSGVSQVGGSLTVTDTTFGADVTNAGGTVAIAGAAAATTTGNIVNTGGDLTIAAGQTLDGNVSNDDAASTTTIDGTLDGTLTVSDGLADNSGTITGATVVNGGTVENSGALGGTVVLDQTGAAAAALDDTDGTITGLVTNVDGVITGDGTDFQSGVSQTGGSLTATDATLGAVSNAGGTVDIAGATAATTTGTITNTGGNLTVATSQTLVGTVANDAATSTTTIDGALTGDLSVSAGVALTNGTVTGATTLTDGLVENTGTLDGTVAVTQAGVATAQFESNGGSVTGLVTNTDGVIVNDGATFAGGVVQDGGSLTVEGGNLGTGVQNTDGQVIISGATPETTVGNVTNFADGALQVDAGQTLDGDVVNTDAGSLVQNAGTIDGNVTATGGVVDSEGLIDGTVAISGVGTNLQAQDGQITGVVTNTGGQIFADQSTFDSGINLNGGGVTVTGDSTGDVRITDGAFQLDAGQSLTGDVSQVDGTSQVSGQIIGALDVNGGQVDHVAGADVTGLTTVADGTFNADGGTFTGGLLLQGGTFNTAVDIVGDVEIDGVTLGFGALQQIDGDLLNTMGDLDFGGTVLGSLTVDGGSVTTATTTTIRDETVVDGGTLIADGGDFAGGISVAGGDAVISQDITTGGLQISDGTLVTDAGTTVAVDLVQTGGVATLNGAFDGDIAVSAGSLTTTSDVSGDLRVLGGDATHGPDGVIDGTTTVTGPGTLFANGGDFTGQITNDGGTVEITGASSGSVTNTAGSVIARSGGSLDGAILNSDALIGDGGSVSGAVTNTGTITVTSGDLSLGSVTSTGTVTVGGGQTLTAATATFEAGSVLDIDNGGLTGDVLADAGADVQLRDATVVGSLTSLTNVTGNGAIVIDGPFALDDAGSFALETGSTDISGTFTVASDAVLDLATGTRLSAADAVSDGAITTTGAVQWEGLLQNNGLLAASGTLAFSGGLTNMGTVDLVNGSTADRVTVSGGDLGGNGTFVFDVDLSDSEGAADRITLTDDAFLTGTVTLQFNVLGSGGQQDADIVLIDLADNDPANFTINADEIVDPSGILTYSVSLNDAGNVVIEDGLNPGIAGLAGNIVLTQSLIGSVVNRPSSPFVPSLAYEDVDPCGAGLWGRTISGGAKSTGEVRQDGNDGRPFDGDISAYYAGLQLGGDYACFNGAAGGWDLAVGAIGGVNTGTTTQPVFAIDVESETNLSSLQTGTTDVTFNQFYAGVYATAGRGPWSIDLQYRLERTNFTATNRGAGGLPGLGLDGTEFSSFATTLSGATSYYYDVPDTNITLIPTAGFAFTQVATDSIAFESRGTVTIDDFDSQIGFIGGTLATSRFGDDGVSAYREFVSATVYNDFADGPRSTFSPIDDSGDRGLTTQNLGLYSEVSVGINYTKVLQEGEFGAVKQVSASARADVRISERLKSWGITAQARYQF